MSFKGVEDSIDQLRSGIDAVAVVLVDLRGDRSIEASPDALAEALGNLACLPVKWGEWFRALQVAGERTDTCDCAQRHQLHGTVIGKRWVLVMVARDLLVSEGSFEPKKALAYAEWVFAIRFFLEEESLGREGSHRPSGGGGAGPAELAIPLSWHRKSHS